MMVVVVVVVVEEEVAVVVMLLLQSPAVQWRSRSTCQPASFASTDWRQVGSQTASDPTHTYSKYVNTKPVIIIK
jgi:hypothetical protein